MILSRLLIVQCRMIEPTFKPHYPKVEGKGVTPWC